MSSQNIPCTNPSVCKVKSHRPGTEALCKRPNRSGGSESKVSGLTASVKPSGGYDTSTEDAIAEAQYLADEQNEVKLKASMKRFMNSPKAQSFNPDSFRANVSRNAYVAEVDKPFSSGGVRFERGDRVYIDAKTRRATPFESKSKHTIQDSINDVKRVALEDQMKEFADSELGDQFYRLTVADVNGRQYSATVEHSFIKDGVHYEAGDKVFIDADSEDISREAPVERRSRLIHEVDRLALDRDLEEFKETELGDQFSDMKVSDVDKRQYSATVDSSFSMNGAVFNSGDKVLIDADTSAITRDNPVDRQRASATRGLIYQYNQAALEGELDEFKNTELGGHFSDMKVSDVDKRQYSGVVINGFKKIGYSFKAGDRIIIDADSMDMRLAQ